MKRALILAVQTIALHPDPSLMSVQNFVANRQPQPTAWKVSVVQAFEGKQRVRSMPDPLSRTVTVHSSVPCSAEITISGSAVERNFKGPMPRYVLPINTSRVSS